MLFQLDDLFGVFFLNSWKLSSRLIISFNLLLRDATLLSIFIQMPPNLQRKKKFYFDDRKNYLQGDLELGGLQRISRIGMLSSTDLNDTLTWRQRLTPWKRVASPDYCHTSNKSPLSFRSLSRPWKWRTPSEDSIKSSRGWSISQLNLSVQSEFLGSQVQARLSPQLLPQSKFNRSSPALTGSRISADGRRSKENLPLIAMGDSPHPESFPNSGAIFGGSLMVPTRPEAPQSTNLDEISRCTLKQRCGLCFRYQRTVIQSHVLSFYVSEETLKEFLRLNLRSPEKIHWQTPSNIPARPISPKTRRIARLVWHSE